MSAGIDVWLVSGLTLLLGMALAVTAAQKRLDRLALEHARDLLALTPTAASEQVRETDLAALPNCVAQWLRRSGIVGRERIHTVRLAQVGQMRAAMDKPWLPVEAIQYINVDQPGFVWKARVRVAPGISMTGLDRFLGGHGYMNIKLLSLIPVVDARPGPEMDMGSMVRFLAEIIWYPSAALNSYLTWEELDSHSARAVMSWQGVEAYMIFRFDQAGDLVSSTAPRYRQVDGRFVLSDWGGEIRSYGEFGGYRIARYTDVLWRSNNGDFNWMQVGVTEWECNPQSA